MPNAARIVLLNHVKKHTELIALRIEARNRAIVFAYGEGASVSELAAAADVSASQVRSILDRTTIDGL